MRWETFEPGIAGETAEHERAVAAIGRWWGAFANKVPALEAGFRGQGSLEGLAEWMRDHLQAISPQLMWEFARGVRGPGTRLTITPEDHAELRPLVREILRRAPALAGWEFYGDRLPEPDLGAVLDLVRQRTNGFDFGGTTVRAQVGERHLVDLTFAVRGGQGPEDRAAQLASFVATDVLLGGELLEQWVGAVGVEKPGWFGRGFAALERLRPTVEAVVGQVREQLPATRWSALEMEAASYTGVQGQPEEAAEYYGSEDIVTASQAYVDMWMAARAPRFYSARFTRHAEKFGIVKVDREGPLDDQTIGRRERMEKGLQAALRKSGAGAVIGGASGLKYDYLDVAVEEAAITDGRVREALREVAQDLKLSRRGWLLFYDADMAEEWVGLWPQTAAPPHPGEGGQG